jgi:DNA invertase Pin-like site-specific DNA recombinase
MLIGYIRVSKSDGSQRTDCQREALIAAGVDPHHIYEDFSSGKNDERIAFAACFKALRPGDTLVVWKIDRLGRNLRNLINTRLLSELKHLIVNRCYSSSKLWIAAISVSLSP